MKAAEVKIDLQKYGSKEHASLLQRYFKTGKGQYAEGDIFIGLRVPQIRKIVRIYKTLELSEIEILLKSKIHEERLTALLILVYQFKQSEKIQKEKIFKFYLKNTKYINNWDLVDLSASKIVGDWLILQGSSFKDNLLVKLATSTKVWERRIAIICTFAFIKKGQLEDTIKVSKILLSDKHDLIQKAVGWALREVGKKDINLLERFIKTNYTQIPRTTLRYAIEKFPHEKRIKYLKRDF